MKEREMEGQGISSTQVRIRKEFRTKIKIPSTILYGPPNEESIDTVKSVYSMMPIVQIISFLSEIETGKNGVGNKQEREKERARVTD